MVSEATTCLDIGLPVGGVGEKQFACEGCKFYHEVGTNRKRSVRQQCDGRPRWQNATRLQKKIVYADFVNYLLVERRLTLEYGDQTTDGHQNDADAGIEAPAPRVLQAGQCTDTHNGETHSSISPTGVADEFEAAFETTSRHVWRKEGSGSTLVAIS